MGGQSRGFFVTGHGVPLHTMAGTSQMEMWCAGVLGITEQRNQSRTEDSARALEALSWTMLGATETN